MLLHRRTRTENEVKSLNTPLIGIYFAHGEISMTLPISIHYRFIIIYYTIYLFIYLFISFEERLNNTSSILCPKTFRHIYCLIIRAVSL